MLQEASQSESTEQDRSIDATCGWMGEGEVWLAIADLVTES